MTTWSTAEPTDPPPNFGSQPSPAPVTHAWNGKTACGLPGNGLTALLGDWRGVVLNRCPDCKNRTD
jgi:hypothetical protein